MRYNGRGRGRGRGRERAGEREGESEREGEGESIRASRGNPLAPFARGNTGNGSRAKKYK